MNVVAKLNAFLGKFVGPNAAHVIDGMIGLGLTGLVAFAFSAPARAFEDKHSLLTVLVMLGAPLMTALASKFRKAAGATNDALIAQIAKAVEDALAARDRDPSGA